MYVDPRVNLLQQQRQQQREQEQQEQMEQCQRAVVITGKRGQRRKRSVEVGVCRVK